MWDPVTWCCGRQRQEGGLMLTAITPAPGSVRDPVSRECGRVWLRRIVMFSLGLCVHVYAVRFSGEVGFYTTTRLVSVISCRAGQGIWGVNITASSIYHNSFALPFRLTFCSRLRAISVLSSLTLLVNSEALFIVLSHSTNREVKAPQSQTLTTESMSGRSRIRSQCLPPHSPMAALHTQ